MKRKNIISECDRLTLWLADGTEVKGYETCLRVRPEEVPEGYNKYDLRETDELDGTIAEIAEFVWVNHFGTFLTEQKLDCRDGIEVVEWNYA